MGQSPELSIGITNRTKKEKEKSMEQATDLRLEITNRTNQTVTIYENGQGKELGKNKVVLYLLHLSLVRITRSELDEIKIYLFGEDLTMPSDRNMEDGMCLCLSEGVSIEFILSQPMNITLKKGKKESVGPDEGVGCGETVD